MSAATSTMNAGAAESTIIQEASSEPPKVSPNTGAILDAFYFRFFEFFSVKGAAPFRVKTSVEDDWFSASGDGSSSTMTSPLLLGILLSLRALNRTWLSRFQVFTHVAAKELVSFNLGFCGPNPSCSRSFTVELKFKGPPSRAEAAERAAHAHYSAFLSGAGMWDRVKDRVASAIAHTGTCDLDAEFGLPDGPQATLLYDVVHPPLAVPDTGPDACPAIRLSKTKLGARLLSSLDTLQGANQVWESETEAVWPQKNHDHVVRSFKLLCLAVHDAYERYVSISIKGGYSFEGMSSRGRLEDYYVECRDAAGKPFWLVFRYSSRSTVEM